MVGAYVAGWALSPLVTGSSLSDLDIYFWQSAQLGAHGHPFTMYSAHMLDAYPNANGPLGILVLTPLAATANALGWSNDVRVHAGMAGALGGLLAVLLAAEVVRIARSGGATITWRLGAPCAILLSPVLWVSLAQYGHLEQIVEVYLVLLAAGLSVRNASVRTGVALGLALLARTTALLYVAPLAVTCAARRGLRSGLRLVGAAALCAAAGLVPFLAADGADVTRSLVTYRGDLPIGGGSLWVAFWSGGPSLIDHADVVLVAVASVALCIWVVRRRPDAAGTTAGVAGLLCVTATCFPMLAKTVYPYYLFEPYVFGVLWWLARPGDALNWRAMIPVLLTVDTFLSSWATRLPLSGLGVVEGVGSSVLLAIVAALIIGDLVRSRMPARDQKTSPRTSTRLALTSSRMVTANTPTNTNATLQGSQVSPNRMTPSTPNLNAHSASIPDPS